MQRWFFLVDPKRPKFRPPKKQPEKKPEPMNTILSQKWVFTVSVPNIGRREQVFITGSSQELGEWDYERLVILENEEGTDLWSKTISIPNTCDVFYRYGTVFVNEECHNVVIRQWETNIKPRVITENTLHPTTDIFGDYDGKTMVIAGWLTTQSLLQFKFTRNPLKLKARLSDRPIFIKVTPVKLTYGNDAMTEDSSLSTDHIDTILPPGAIVEVSTLDDDPSLCLLTPQEQFGREYRPNDIMIVNMTIPNHKELAYLLDFYIYSSRAAPEDPPCHVGYTYVLPNMFISSEGLLNLPVTCNVKHRPLGTVTFEYLIVHPMEEKLCDFRVSYAKYWNQKWMGLEVGHRGLGASFKTKGNPIRENTIASLKKAAASGADLLEFDVQLSKDLVPVIYHDFYVCMSLKRKREVEFSAMLELPVKDLTLDQLQKLKVYHLVEGRNHESLFDDEEFEEHQPFPTLELALKTIDMHVGFNIELKWTMQLDDGTYELYNPFDMNTYVDKVLEVVLKHAGERCIVFSCFNPDICTMVRNKQNKYPVMFLTVGVTTKYKPYRDPRCSTILAAVQNAVSSNLLGIVVHTEDLLRDPTQVKLATDAGLVIFCWGDDNNDKDTIQLLKNMGLHAVIYDKLDQYTTKQIKESIFLVENKRDILELAALKDKDLVKDVISEDDTIVGENVIAKDEVIEDDKSASPSDGSSSLSEVPPVIPAPPSVYLNLLNVRKKIQDTSAATSLASLACSIDLRDDPTIKNLKRDREIIMPIDKETQLKEHVKMFKKAYPACFQEPPQATSEQ